MTPDKTYECDICHGVNSVSRLHCQHCGTIPAMYSIIGLPAVERLGDISTSYIRVLVAFGAIRQTSARTIKRTARTVPMDYYAEV